MGLVGLTTCSDDGRSLEISRPVSMAASLRGSEAGRPRSNQSRTSKLSQLVKSAAERQEQRPVSSASRSEQASQHHGAPRAHAGQQRTRGEEEASFYSEEEDSEDDEDEL